MRAATIISALSLASAGLFLAPNAIADASHGRNEDSIRVHLKGFEEVPAVVTGATGELRLTINEAAGTIAYNLTYENLEGDVRQAHIHIGQRDVAGGIAIWLCQTTFNPAPAAVAATTPTCPGPRSGTVSGMVGAANVIGPAGQLVAAGELGDVIRAIRAGKAYGNVHSLAVPGGEIRGQLH
jgi:hypothetical protein